MDRRGRRGRQQSGQASRHRNEGKEPHLSVEEREQRRSLIEGAVINVFDAEISAGGRLNSTSGLPANARSDGLRGVDADLSDPFSDSDEDEHEDEGGDGHGDTSAQEMADGDHATIHSNNSTNNDDIGTTQACHGEKQQQRQKQARGGSSDSEAFHIPDERPFHTHTAHASSSSAVDNSASSSASGLGAGSVMSSTTPKGTRRSPFAAPTTQPHLQNPPVSSWPASAKQSLTPRSGRVNPFQSPQAPGGAESVSHEKSLRSQRALVEAFGGEDHYNARADLRPSHAAALSSTSSSVSGGSATSLAKAQGVSQPDAHPDMSTAIPHHATTTTTNNNNTTTTTNNNNTNHSIAAGKDKHNDGGGGEWGIELVEPPGQAGRGAAHGGPSPEDLVLMQVISEEEEKAIQANAYAWLRADASTRASVVEARREELLASDLLAASPRLQQEWTDLLRFRDRLLREATGHNDDDDGDDDAADDEDDRSKGDDHRNGACGLGAATESLQWEMQQGVGPRAGRRAKRREQRRPRQRQRQRQREESSSCTECRRHGRTTTFNPFRPRVECANCGSAVCGACSGNRLLLPTGDGRGGGGGVGAAKPRVCQSCYRRITTAKRAGTCVRIVHKQGNERVFWLVELPASLWRMKGVTELHLTSTQLRHLPPQVAMLETLQVLNLADNFLSHVPASIGSLKALRALRVNGNFLLELPPSFSGLVSLETMNLATNQLKQVPAWLGLLPHLHTLDISNNPDLDPATHRHLGACIHLSCLRARNTNVKRLPTALWRLTSLRELDLSTNSITKVPMAVCCLRELQTLDLSHNYVHVLPESIMHLEDLEVLRLGGNRGLLIPEALGALWQLRELYLNHCDLDTVPPTLGSLRGLTKLDLRCNRLHALPPALLQLSQLTCLRMEGNPGFLVHKKAGTTPRRRAQTATSSENAGPDAVLGERDRQHKKSAPRGMATTHAAGGGNGGAGGQTAADLREALKRLRIGVSNEDGGGDGGERGANDGHEADAANPLSLLKEFASTPSSLSPASRSHAHSRRPSVSASGSKLQAQHDEGVGPTRGAPTQSGVDMGFSVTQELHPLQVVVWQATPDLDLRWLCDKLTGPVYLPAVRENLPHLSTMLPDEFSAESLMTQEHQQQQDHHHRHDEEHHQRQSSSVICAAQVAAHDTYKHSSNLLFDTDLVTVDPSAVPVIAQTDLTIPAGLSSSSSMDNDTWPDNIRLSVLHHRGPLRDGVLQQLCHAQRAVPRVHLLCVDLGLSHDELLIRDTQELLSELATCFPGDRIQLLGIKPVHMRDHVAAAKQVVVWDAAQSLLYARRRAITNECVQLPLSLTQHPGFVSRRAARKFGLYHRRSTSTATAATPIQHTVGARLQFWEEQRINTGRTCLVVSKRDYGQIFRFLRKQAHVIAAASPSPRQSLALAQEKRDDHPLDDSRQQQQQEQEPASSYSAHSHVPAECTRMAQYLQLLYNQGVVARSASALLSHLRLEHWNPIRTNVAWLLSPRVQFRRRGHKGTSLRLTQSASNTPRHLTPRSKTPVDRPASSKLPSRPGALSPPPLAGTTTSRSPSLAQALRDKLSRRSEPNLAGDRSNRRQQQQQQQQQQQAGHRAKQKEQPVDQSGRSSDMFARQDRKQQQQQQQQQQRLHEEEEEEGDEWRAANHDLPALMDMACRASGICTFLGNTADDVVFVNAGLLGHAVGALTHFHVDWIKHITRATLPAHLRGRVKALRQGLERYCATGELLPDEMSAVFVAYNQQWLQQVNAIEKPSRRLLRLRSVREHVLQVLVAMDVYHVIEALCELQLCCFLPNTATGAATSRPTSSISSASSIFLSASKSAFSLGLPTSTPNNATTGIASSSGNISSGAPLPSASGPPVALTSTTNTAAKRGHVLSVDQSAKAHTSNPALARSSASAPAAAGHGPSGGTATTDSTTSAAAAAAAAALDTSQQRKKLAGAQSKAPVFFLPRRPPAPSEAAVQLFDAMVSPPSTSWTDAFRSSGDSSGLGGRAGGGVGAHRAGRVVRMNHMPTSLLASLACMCSTRYARIHVWERGMLLCPVSEHGAMRSLLLVCCSFDPDMHPHMPFSMSFLALGNHKDMLGATNALVAAQLPAVASLEHLLVTDFPGVIWTAEACCPNCLLTHDMSSLQTLVARGLQGQFPLGSLTNVAYIDCSMCHSSTSTPPLLLNFMMHEKEDDPGRSYQLNSVQNLIEGLGRIVVQPYKGVSEHDTGEDDAEDADWQVLDVPKSEEVSLKSPVNATFEDNDNDCDDGDVDV